MRAVLLVLFFSHLASCWMVRVYRLRRMDLTDYKKLPSVVIHKPEVSYPFIEGTTQTQYRGLKEYLDSGLASTQTAAFLIIRNDSLIYEHYFYGFSKDDMLPSNSMAKSFTGTLVSIALHEGKIHSLSEPITDYIPELLKRDSNFKRITIQHLLDMRSGLDFNEGKYDLKDDAIRMGLRPNLRKHMLRIKIAEPPGRFRYQSINTQFLGMIVERATGKKISAYLEEKLWKPLGAEHDARWNVDSKKRRTELTSAGLNATPRDFARLGQLYINKGRWKDQQIVDSNWINLIGNVDTMEKYGGYKNQWWNRAVFRSFEDSAAANAFAKTTNYVSAFRNTTNGYHVYYRDPVFSAIGFMSQYIYVNPQKKLVIVRIGKRWTHTEVYSTQFIYGLGERL